MPKKEVNPIRRARLVQLMDEMNISQKELERQTGIKQQNISMMVRGLLNVSGPNAEAIAAAYPEIRIQWLMGYDDFKTDAELTAFVLAGVESAKSGSEIPALGGTALDASMFLLSQLSGFKLSLWRNRMGGTNDVEYVVEQIKRGCIVSRDGKSAEIDIDRWSEISNEVCDLVEFLLQREINRANPAHKGERQ
ncbi:MAG: helix-turn-helix transcriptional regulator [Eggerthellaceae bacterium]|nr:helix-turn-helix transcriptional regulator [Eggerthellaceae bacterium]